MRAQVKVKSTEVAWKLKSAEAVRQINSLNGLDLDAIEKGRFQIQVPDERNAAEKHMDQMWLEQMDRCWFQAISDIFGVDLTGALEDRVGNLRKQYDVHAHQAPVAFPMTVGLVGSPIGY